MSKKEKCVNKKLHPYWKTGIYGWLGEEVDDNDYMCCPICGEILAMNYWDYSAEHDGDNKCPKCGQELDYSEIYDFEDTLYFRQLLEMKDEQIEQLEHRLSNCIEPKFKIGQEIWETRPFMAWEVTSIKFEKHDGILYQMYHLGHKGTDDYNCCIVPSDNDRFFATEEEAKAKLREIQDGR